MILAELQSQAARAFTHWNLLSSESLSKSNRRGGLDSKQSKNPLDRRLAAFKSLELLEADLHVSAFFGSIIYHHREHREESDSFAVEEHDPDPDPDFEFDLDRPGTLSRPRTGTPGDWNAPLEARRFQRAG